ncbi:MAG TPA: GNAT family N-acetyltransferase [Actinomycetota bacterium]
MAELDPLLRFWRAQDSVFERVEEHWWGAVVSDARYPRIQEANYARVETRQPVALDEIDPELLPAMERSCAGRSHVVIFHPEDQTDLLVHASTRGERLTWDLVMEHAGAAPAPDPRVNEVRSFDAGFWRAYQESSRLFDIADERDLEQLQAIERDRLIPAGRRWFAVREDGEPVAFAALLVLEGVGYIDHVVTVPQARRRGHAAALTDRLLAEAATAGAERTYLLAEPQGVAARMYRRRGFRAVTRLASWISERR